MNRKFYPTDFIIRLINDAIFHARKQKTFWFDCIVSKVKFMNICFLGQQRRDEKDLE